MPTPDIKESPLRQADCTMGSWSATRTFTAAYYSDDIAVADALAGLSPPVIINGAHPAQPALRCAGPVIKQVSPVFWEITAKYSYGDKSDPNPANNKPTISWEDANTTEQTDVDSSGFVVQSSSGQPFATGLPADIGGDILVIVRNEPFYVPQINGRFRNAVNTDSFSPLGLFALEPGQAKCRSIRPTRSYQTTDIFVPIAYRFEFRGGRVKDADGLWDGFKDRVADKGTTGFWVNAATVTVPGNFYFARTATTAAARYTNDVILDGTGKPIDTTILCGADSASATTPVANPKPLPANVTVEKTANGAWLKYSMFKKDTLSAIGL